MKSLVSCFSIVWATIECSLSSCLLVALPWGPSSPLMWPALAQGALHLLAELLHPGSGALDATERVLDLVYGKFHFRQAGGNTFLELPWPFFALSIHGLLTLFVNDLTAGWTSCQNKMPSRLSFVTSYSSVSLPCNETLFQIRTLVILERLVQSNCLSPRRSKWKKRL